MKPQLKPPNLWKNYTAALVEALRQQYKYAYQLLINFSLKIKYEMISWEIILIFNVFICVFK